MHVYSRLENGTLVPSIPEPFWYGGGLFSLFRYHPACYQCVNPKTGKSPLHLKNEAEWKEHYIKFHLDDEDRFLYMMRKNGAKYGAK
jgi:hypothetical protein